MRRFQVFMALTVVTGLVVVSAAWAQRPAAQRQGGQRQGGVFFGRGGMNPEMMLMIRDIMSLRELNSLQLSNQQITDILQACDKAVTKQTTSNQKADMAKLQALRQRLLEGQQMTTQDEEMLRGIFRNARNGGQGQPATAQLAAEEQSIWKTLNDDQKAVLLEGGRQGAGANDQAHQQAALTAFITHLGQIKNLDGPYWNAKRDHLAEALSAKAGPVGSPAWKNTHAKLMEFLGIVRGMSDADFQQQQQSLTSQLAAMLPPGTDLTLAVADSRTIERAVGRVFDNTQTVELLREMQKARAKQGQAGQG